MVTRLREHLVPAQAAVLAPAVPFDAQLLAGDRTRDQVHRVLLRVRVLAGAERADVELPELLARVAEGGAGLGIDVDDRAGVDVVHEDRVFGGVEDRAIARLRHAQRLVRALALGHVGGDAAHGVRLAVGVVQRELDRDVGVRAVVERRGLLELHRRIALQDEEVVVAKCLRRLFGQRFAFGLSDRRRRGANGRGAPTDG